MRKFLWLWMLFVVASCAGGRKLALVKEGGVAGVMGAYNRTNGEPCCAHSYLMEKVLRTDWGFDGYFVSDCGALGDIWKFHNCASSAAEAAALSIKSSCDLNCGDTYTSLGEAYEMDLIYEADITAA